jgi:hypothetical protein
MPAGEKGHKGFNSKLKKKIKAAEKNFAPVAVCLNGLSFMVRASSLGGGL